LESSGWLLHFESEEEAITLANLPETGLASYVFTRDNARRWRLVEALHAGMVGGHRIATGVAPFGGITSSGLDHVGSRSGLDHWLNLKCVNGAL
jgi:succinate-semialdehyde dehydrogenase/glutarate-semialdehyde dehydrogenase